MDYIHAPKELFGHDFPLPASQNGDGLTDQKRLRNERDFWKHLFEELVADFPEPVLVVNDEGIITHWNDPHIELSGISHEDAIGNEAIEALGTEGMEETLAEEIARTGETVREDIIRPGGSEENEWHIRAAGTPIRAPDGEIVGAFEYVAIVTELIQQRHHLEEVQGAISETVYDAGEDLFKATKTTADTNTEEISCQGESAADLADDSIEATQTILSLVEDIRDAAEELSANSQPLEARIEEIDTIVEVIDEIADGTNLLALNANIQAAQFGADAAGFGVVADEVKSLADKSKAQVGTIEEIVGEVRENTDNTLDSVEMTIDCVGKAIEHSRIVDEKQSEIKTAVDEATLGIGQIAEATDDQAATTEEVATMLNSAVEQMEELASEVDTLVDVNEQKVENIHSVRYDVQELESQPVSSLDER